MSLSPLSFWRFAAWGASQTIMGCDKAARLHMTLNLRGMAGCRRQAASRLCPGTVGPEPGLPAASPPDEEARLAATPAADRISPPLRWSPYFLFVLLAYDGTIGEISKTGGHVRPHLPISPGMSALTFALTSSRWSEHSQDDGTPKGLKIRVQCGSAGDVGHGDAQMIARGPGWARRDMVDPVRG